MGRRPRTDIERAARYATKLVPANVGDILDARLPSMQASAATWFNHQAALYSQINGILAGFYVPSFQYARYYAFGLQVDKQTRRFGYSPAAQDAIAQIEATWVSRGYDVTILDAIRSTVVSFDGFFSILAPHYPGHPVVNQLTGHAVAAGAIDNFMMFADPVTRAIRTATLSTGPAFGLVSCDELSRAYYYTSGDVIGGVLESTLADTQWPVTAADGPSGNAVDYDPSKWPSPVLGYLWTACNGHPKLYKTRLDLSLAPVSITLPHIANQVCVDKSKNVVYVTASGTAAIYVIDRGTNAISVKTPPHIGHYMALDPVKGELWMSCEGSNFVMKMDTTTFAFTAYAVDESDDVIYVDSIRHVAYYPQLVFGNIRTIDSGYGFVGTFVVPANFIGMTLDAGASILTWCTGHDGILHRVNLASFVVQLITLPDISAMGLAADLVRHSTWVADYTPPSGSKFLYDVLV